MRSRPMACPRAPASPAWPARHGLDGAAGLLGLLAAWLPEQRWFPGRGARLSDLSVVSDVSLLAGEPALRHLIVQTTLRSGPARFQVLVGYSSVPKILKFGGCTVLGRFGLFILITLTSLPLALAADQVTLKNGDRLTGTVVKGDGKTLVLHTDAAGDLTIQFSAIQEIKTVGELHVSLKNGKTAVGPVTATDGKLEIATQTRTVEAPATDVTLIRDDAEQAAYDKSLHPGLAHGWTGGANVGFSCLAETARLRTWPWR